VGLRVLNKGKRVGTFGVLPVTDAQPHLPVTLLLDGDAAREREHILKGGK
jgi:hypothetical protein